MTSIVVSRCGKTSSYRPKNLNIEKVHEMVCIFPDSSKANIERTGGYNNNDDFKDVTLNSFLKDKQNATIKLISRPKQDILRDYEDEKFLKTFPLQSPYGLGND